jgi:hypothetical protein
VRTVRGAASDTSVEDAIENRTVCGDDADHARSLRDLSASMDGREDQSGL